MAQEANAGASKGDGKTGNTWSAPPPTFPDNWPDTGSARTRKGADVGRVSL